MRSAILAAMKKRSGGGTKPGSEWFHTPNEARHAKMIQITLTERERAEFERLVALHAHEMPEDERRPGHRRSGVSGMVALMLERWLAAENKA